MGRKKSNALHGAVPAYWRKNVAMNATRNALKTSGFKKQVELDRFAIGQVVSYCAIIAAHDRLGLDKSEIELLTAEMNSCAGVYMMERQHRGQAFARNGLAQRADYPAVQKFVLPAGRMPRNDRERRRLAERRDAADMVIRFYAGALGKRGCSPQEIAAAVHEATKNYGQFLEWANDGEDVAYEKIRRVIEQTIDVPVRIEEVEGEPPVFGERF